MNKGILSVFPLVVQSSLSSIGVRELEVEERVSLRRVSLKSRML